MDLLLALVAGLAAGAAIAWFAARARFGTDAAALRVQLQMAGEQAARDRQQAEEMLRAERERQRESLAAVEQARQAMSDQFKALASEILEDKSRRFTEQNQTNLKTLLDPLRTQIGEFKAKVEEVYVAEGKDRSALKQQIEHLAQLNQTLRADTVNLTEALKGSAKARGNWGELILARVLEMAGLEEGVHYDVQVSHSTEEGRLQPDVVIHLPGGRHLVVDSKVSLVAYDAYHAAADDTGREAAQKAHTGSVRAHIRGLSEKDYPSLYGLESLDFVLMFVPIESAFMLAIGRDAQLFEDAWNRNVLLVSPSTLLFVVRTVANLWRQEQQTRNAQEIAERGAALYDKFAGFAEALEAIGDKLGQARGAYDNALTRFSGNGGLLAQTQMLKKLGVKARKEVPDSMRRRLAEDAAGEALPPPDEG